MEGRADLGLPVGPALESRAFACKRPGAAADLEACLHKLEGGLERSLCCKSDPKAADVMTDTAAVLAMPARPAGPAMPAVPAVNGGKVCKLSPNASCPALASVTVVPARGDINTGVDTGSLCD